MDTIYRVFASARTALIILLLAMATPAIAAQDSAFTVRNVKVDVTAESAAAAREQAFAQAEQIAFRQLAQRLLSDVEMAIFQMPETSVISTLINDFEITEEQLSRVQYIAAYTFRFKKDAVRNYLGGSGLSYTDVSSKPVLVLPYYQWGSRTILWGDDNPWLAAWTRSEMRDGLVPVVVPIGDLMDVSDMSDSDALTYIPENLARMSERYGAGDTVMMIAAPIWAQNQPETQIPAEINIMIYRTGSTGPEMAQNLKIRALPEDSAIVLFDRAVQEAQKALQLEWKDKTLITAGQDNNLQARVRFTSMEEWIETQKKLRRVQGVLDIRLLSLKSSQAHIELIFNGNEDRLRLALAQADMTLTKPQIDFAALYQASEGPRKSPLIYDLYLNKFNPARMLP